jgi:hypothetical protein
MEMTEKILNIINNELASIMKLKPEYYNGYSIEVAEEQYFYKKNKQIPGKIYIVVKFSEAPLNYEQIIMPITIEAISEQDKFEVCRNLLFEFSAKYNLHKEAYNEEDQYIQQIYMSPYILSNFNEVFEGFRSLLYVSGTFLITENANYCSMYFSSVDIKDKDKKEFAKVVLQRETDEGVVEEELEINLNKFRKSMKKHGYSLEDKTYEWIFDGGWKSNGQLLKGNFYEYGIQNQYFLENGDKLLIEYHPGWQMLDLLSIDSVCDISLDSQAFYNNNNFVSSVGKFGTFTVNITSYLFKNEFLNKCLAVYLQNTDKETNGVNTDFNLLLEFDDGENYAIKPFKMAHLSLKQTVGDIPLVSITFTI